MPILKIHKTIGEESVYNSFQFTLLVTQNVMILYKTPLLGAISIEVGDHYGIFVYTKTSRKRNIRIQK